MDAWSRAYGTDAFVNVPGRDAKFHAAWRSNVGRVVGRAVGRVVSRVVGRLIGHHIGLDTRGNEFDNSAMPG